MKVDSPSARPWIGYESIIGIMPGGKRLQPELMTFSREMKHTRLKSAEMSKKFIRVITVPLQQPKEIELTPSLNCMSKGFSSIHTLSEKWHLNCPLISRRRSPQLKLEVCRG